MVESIVSTVLQAADAGKSDIELPPNSKIMMNENGTASIVSYDMGVILEIPESETANFVTVDKEWKPELQLDESVQEEGPDEEGR